MAPNLTTPAHSRRPLASYSGRRCLSGLAIRASLGTCTALLLGISLTLTSGVVTAGTVPSAGWSNHVPVSTAVSVATTAAACPFCSAINMTFWEQIKSHDAVVIARLITLPPPVAEIDAELPKAEFEVVRVLRGGEHIEPEAMFRVLLVGDYPVGQEFVVMGVNPPGFIWSTPLKATPRVVEYVENLGKLPEKGPERLTFFQKYFEDEESVLAFDAYDEFARAPYEDVIALKDQMDHDQLVKWILDPETSVNRRRLYFTMLGICGGPADLQLLERLLRSDDRKEQAGLDALVSCYLKLKGPDGLELIEQEFLKNEEADYVDTLATISALRFHGSEEKVIPRERLVTAIRTLLDRPKMADMIIPDLARWEDWSVMEKLVELFKNSTEDTIWVRVPVIQYLQVCPRPEAKKYIEELRKIDPDAVARAALFNEIDLGSEEETDDTPAEAGGGGESPQTPASGSSGGSSGGGGTPENLELLPQTVLRVPFSKETLLSKETLPDAAPSGIPPAVVMEASVSAANPVSSSPNTENLNEPSAAVTVEQGEAGRFRPDVSAAVISAATTAAAVEIGAADKVAATESGVMIPAGPFAPGTMTSLLPAGAPAIPAAASPAMIPVDIGPVDSLGSENLPMAVVGPTSAPARFWTLRAIVLPIGCGCLLFALLWSVINGWFERLIF